MIPFILLAPNVTLRSLLAQGEIAPGLLLTSLGAAFFLGAAHGLTPGHGKALVAAYMVGSRGRVRDAFYLGGLLTITHTASVFGLGLLAIIASQRVPLDRVYPWMAFASGVLVAVLGAWLLVQRIRHAAGSHTHHHHHQNLEENKAILSLGISGGLVPCPEALVVLLMSISAGKLALGLAVLVSFSLGLAAVLIAVGLAAVTSGPLLKRSFGKHRWFQGLPVISAAAVFAFGLLVLAQAAAQLAARP